MFKLFNEIFYGALDGLTSVVTSGCGNTSEDNSNNFSVETSETSVEKCANTSEGEYVREGSEMDETVNRDEATNTCVGGSSYVHTEEGKEEQEVLEGANVTNRM